MTKEEGNEQEAEEGSIRTIFLVSNLNKGHKKGAASMTVG